MRNENHVMIIRNDQDTIELN